MRIRKFYFIPYIEEKGRKKDKETNVPCVNISKIGLLQFTTQTINHFGWKNGDILKFFYDREKRALAFMKCEKLNQTDLREMNSITYKYVKIKDGLAKKRRQEYIQKGIEVDSKVFVVSFGKFILSLPNNDIPKAHIPIEIYNDTDLGCTLNYFIIPEKKDKKINQYYKPDLISVDN